MPGALGKQRIAVVGDIAVGVCRAVVEGGNAGCAQSGAELRSIGRDTVAQQIAPEIIGAHHIVEGATGRGRDAQFLAELLDVIRNANVTYDIGTAEV
jgi:hypothetical protein